jgi:uncharacterized membrane protein YcaP (DUF421 family)
LVGRASKKELERMHPFDLGPILPELPPLAYILRPLAVYLLVLLALRLIGKREVGALGPGEFVVLLLLSETLHGALVAGTESFLGSLIAAMTLLMANWIVVILTARSRRLHQTVTPDPTILVHRGRYFDEQMRRERISRAELDHQLRTKGIFTIRDVDLAVLEPDGQISIRRVEDAQKPLDTELPEPTQQQFPDGH